MIRKILSALFISIACDAAAVALGFALSPFVKSHHLTLFLTAVIVAALYGGYLAGFVTVFLALISHNYFFQFPRFSFSVGSSGDWFELVFFLIVASLTSWLGSHIRQARLTAERETRAREDLMGMISHDLKNPLGAILMNAQMISREQATTPKEIKMRRRAETILSVSRRMNKLIEEILMFGKIKSGKFVAELKRENVQTIVDEVVEVMKPIAAQKNLGFDVIADENIEMHCDRDGIYQVLSNLLGNAIKFTEQGNVTLKVAKHDDCVVFDVEDGGPGIPAEEADRIFDRYWQAASTAKKGTGLGLFITKGIVEAHGGSVSVKNLAGRGADFSFSIPAESPK